MHPQLAKRQARVGWYAVTIYANCPCPYLVDTIDHFLHTASVHRPEHTHMRVDLPVAR